jgi:hypothetical protein
MPTIYEYFGLIFRILTRGEHNPVHVHVKSGNKESVIEIIVSDRTRKVLEVKKRRVGNSASTAKQLSEKDLSTALKFVNAKAEEFVEIWDAILVNKYKGKPTKITRKIV